MARKKKTDPNPTPEPQPNPKKAKAKTTKPTKDKPQGPLKTIIPNPPPPITPLPEPDTNPPKSHSRITYQTVLMMESYHVRRYTHDQIAEILGVHRITVQRCLAKLRRQRLDRANPRTILADRIASLHNIIEQAWKAWDKTLEDEPGVQADPTKPAGPFNRDMPGKRGLGNDKYLQTIRDAQRELSQIYMVGEYDAEHKRILREFAQSDNEDGQGDATGANLSASDLRRELEYLRERIKEDQQALGEG